MTGPGVDQYGQCTLMSETGGVTFFKGALDDGETFL